MIQGPLNQVFGTPQNGVSGEIKALFSEQKISRSTPQTNEEIRACLKHLLDQFGLEHLEQRSKEELAYLLDGYHRSNGFSQGNILTTKHSHLLTELHRRITRLAGAQLDDAFLAIAHQVIAEEDTDAMQYEVEGRKLQGIRYRGEVYRLVQTFHPCHRLQAFCLGQSLSQQQSSYLITASEDRFAVWLNIRAIERLPFHRHNG